MENVTEKMKTIAEREKLLVIEKRIKLFGLIASSLAIGYFIGRIYGY